MYVEFSGDCLKQEKATLNHGKILNIYIVYDVKSNLNDLGYGMENCSVQLILLKPLKLLKIMTRLMV